MLLVGMVATLSALVMGLIISTAKTSFDADRASVVEMAADILLIDRTLAHYGDDSKAARDALRGFNQRAIAGIDAHDKQEHQAVTAPATPLPQLEKVLAELLSLSPSSDTQRWLRLRALALTGDLERARVIFGERGKASIAPAFVVVLTAWLAMLFVALAIFAPNNATAALTAFGGALAFAAALFLILELDTPFEGLLRLSSDPLIKTLGLLGR